MLSQSDLDLIELPYGTARRAQGYPVHKVREQVISDYLSCCIRSDISRPARLYFCELNDD